MSKDVRQQMLDEFAQAMSAERARANMDGALGGTSMEQTLLHYFPAGCKTVEDELDKQLIKTAAAAYTWWANRRGDVLPKHEPVVPEVTQDGKVVGHVVGQSVNNGVLSVELEMEDGRRMSGVIPLVDRPPAFVLADDCPAVSPNTGYKCRLPAGHAPIRGWDHATLDGGLWNDSKR